MTRSISRVILGMVYKASAMEPVNMYEIPAESSRLAINFMNSNCSFIMNQIIPLSKDFLTCLWIA